jgi:hypothetical protein
MVPYLLQKLPVLSYGIKIYLKYNIGNCGLDSSASG